MKEEKNITHHDMRFFQNDLLNDMKKLELQLNGRISGINQTLLTKTSEYDSKFIKIFENITELISQMAERKYDNDRVEELIKMRNKFSDQIIENQSRISIIDKTLENALFKYDKIILDNLNVPGLIGVGCKFKNCAAYFRFLENEYQVNQKFKEEGILNFKSLSDKIDLRLKKSEGDISKILQSVNQICDVKFEKIFQKMEEKALATDNYVAQVRIENSKYANDLIKASKELKIEWDMLEKVKNEIYEKFQSEVDVCKKLVIVTEKNFKKQKEEFNVFKQRFSQLAEYLKDVKNLGKNYREMAKNIDFSKKQKLDEEFDQEKYGEIGENVKEFIRSPSPRRNRGTFILKLQDNYKNEDEDNPLVPGEHKRKLNKRASLSPNPRRTSIYMKKKKLEELDTINQIAEEGSNRLDKVLNLKNKLKELNDENKDNNNKVKKNLNEYYKTELRKKKQDEEENKKKEKMAKTLLRKKTIVTENKIDLNFNMNKEDDKEESGNSSSSSNFELSSIISLKKIGDDNKDNEENKIKQQNQNKKDMKNKENKLIEETKTEKEKEKEKMTLNLNKDKNSFSSKEETILKKPSKNSKIIKISNSESSDSDSDSNSKSETSFKEDETVSNKQKVEKEENNKEKEKEKEKEESNALEKKDEKTENGKINKQPTEDNKNKKKGTFKTPKKIREREPSKRIKEIEPQIKSQKKVKNQQKNLKINISKEKSTTINQDIDKKANSPILKKRALNLDPIDPKNKKKFHNNVLSTYNESRHDNSKDKQQKAKPVTVYNKQIKQAMDEYTNKNSNNINKPLNNKTTNEVTFPQIKTVSTETIKRENLNKTRKENKNIKNKLILDHNKTKPFTFKGLLTTTNQRLNINSNNNININANKEITSSSVDKKESKEKIENKENSKDNKDNIIDNNNKEKEELKDEANEKSKEEKDIIKSLESIEKKENNTKKEEDDVNIKFLFNSLYDEIKEIKAITTKNNINKEKENITNKNAFLTSLNTVSNNNFNYYYNSNPDENRSNFITIANPKETKKIDDEAIKKLNNEIDFINGNIKLVNHKISNLENRYQLILNQLNNIFKTVSSYYHHHKRKSEQHHTFRMKNKLGEINQKMDQQKIGEILNDKNFMMKIKDIYNDDYENIDEYKLKIPNDEYSKTLRKIEPFLIKKFKKI